MRQNIPWCRILPGVILTTASAHLAQAQATADRQQEVEMAFDHYTTAKTDSQRAVILDYLHHLDPTLAANALADHIIASRNGIQATNYNQFLESFGPKACAVVLDRLSKSDDPIAKGKLIVALRHCPNSDSIHVLTVCLDDKRNVPFEAHTAHPRRVCDLAYDELFLKLRHDPRFGFDPTPHMKGIITEHTPVKERDTLIATLKKKLAATPATATPSPGPAKTASPGAPSPQPKTSGTAVSARL